MNTTIYTSSKILYWYSYCTIHTCKLIIKSWASSCLLFCLSLSKHVCFIAWQIRWYFFCILFSPYILFRASEKDKTDWFTVLCSQGIKKCKRNYIRRSVRWLWCKYTVLLTKSNKLYVWLTTYLKKSSHNLRLHTYIQIITPRNHYKIQMKIHKIKTTK